MCGICGFINRDGRPASQDIIHRMNTVIAHRGPDDSGVYIDGPLALGHRRLSIVDLARGHQPMKSPLNEQVIIFNGEIYNHMQIRKQLDVTESDYHTTCDTETILVAYHRHKAKSVEALRGMFAFAIYDPSDKSFFLVRDRLGIKPVYMYQSERLFAFASEIKALLEHPDIRAEVNVEKLPQQLTLKYTLDDETLFKGIKKLQPGHWLKIANNQIMVQRYWDMSFTPKTKYTSDDEAIAHFRDKFNDSVKARLMADVPLGVFLSGGIDSSVIAASMAKLVDEPITSFSVAFQERNYSEFEYSRAVAKHIGAHLREVTVTPEEWFAAWPRMVYHEDEPIAHPSSIPLHFVSKLAAKEVKVVLTGEGADELLAGYERYYQTVYNMRFSAFWPYPLRVLSRSFIDLLPDTFIGKRKAVRTALYLPPDIESIFLDNYSAFKRDSMHGALQPSVVKSSVYGAYSQFIDLMNHNDADNLLEKLLYADLKTYLLELLMKQDQMSMSVSIESRVPFLDHELVELSCKLPTHLKLKGFETKRIERLALGDTVPEQIVTRAKKGFPTPTREWFRGEYYPIIERLLLSRESLSQQYIRPEFARGILERHRANQWNLEEQIWTLANFEIWLRIFIGGQQPDEIFAEEKQIAECVSSG